MGSRTAPGRSSVVLALAIALVAACVGAGCVPSPQPSAAPGGTTAYVQHIPADQVDSWRGSHYDALLVDVRDFIDPSEGGVFAGELLHVPLNQLEAQKGEIKAPKERTILVFDGNGTWVTRAGQLLVESGYRDVTVIDGGVQAYRNWQKTRQ